MKLTAQWEEHLENVTWKSWSPTVTAAIGTINSYNVVRAKYLLLGKMILYVVEVSFSDIGTASGDIRISLPTGLTFTGGGMFGCGRETAATGVMLQAMFLSSTGIIIWDHDNSFSAANGNTLLVSGFGRLA
jgi:hypothetical protein